MKFVPANLGRVHKLSDGTVHYQLEGPEVGEIVRLIHGMTIPSFVWITASKCWRKKGFMCSRYDLHGRGYSDRPKVKAHNRLMHSPTL